MDIFNFKDILDSIKNTLNKLEKNIGDPSLNIINKALDIIIPGAMIYGFNKNFLSLFNSPWFTFILLVSNITNINYSKNKIYNTIIKLSPLIAFFIYKIAKNFYIKNTNLIQMPSKILLFVSNILFSNLTLFAIIAVLALSAFLLYKFKDSITPKQALQLFAILLAVISLGYLYTILPGPIQAVLFPFKLIELLCKFFLSKPNIILCCSFALKILTGFVKSVFFIATIMNNVLLQPNILAFNVKMLVTLFKLLIEDKHPWEKLYNSSTQEFSPDKDTAIMQSIFNLVYYYISMNKLKKLSGLMLAMMKVFPFSSFIFSIPILINKAGLSKYFTIGSFLAFRVYINHHKNINPVNLNKIAQSIFSVLSWNIAIDEALHYATQQSSRWNFVICSLFCECLSQFNLMGKIFGPSSHSDL